MMPSVLPLPYDQLLPLATPNVKIFWERLNTQREIVRERLVRFESGLIFFKS